MSHHSIFNYGAKLMNIRINPCHLKSEGKESVQQQMMFARAHGMSLNDISKVSPISRATMYRWSRTDMSSNSQKERQNHPRREQLLNEEEKAQLIQKAKEQRSNHQPVSVEWTRQSINEITGGRVPNASNGFISKFWRESGWPSRRTQKRNH